MPVKDVAEMSIKDVEDFDAKWYSKISGLWMDLIGDYAGTELFVLDGDAVCQYVLDDPLLALGRTNDSSFQLLHAIYSLEKLIFAFSSRQCVFEVVFFESNRHATIKSGDNPYTRSSRRLARAVFKSHLKTLNVPSQTFVDLEDKSWLNFVRLKRPMFVCCGDGKLLDANSTSLEAERVLLQRLFIFDVLKSGIAVTMLPVAEFKNSKIMSFVYEQRRADMPLSTSFQVARNQSIKTLEDAEKDALFDQSDIDHAKIQSNESWITAAVQLFSDISADDQPLMLSLLYLFVAHAQILDCVGLEERAQPLPTVHPSLEEYLRISFFPILFGCLEQSLPSTVSFLPDLDGRVFLSLLREMCHEGSVLSEVVGDEIYCRVQSIWEAVFDQEPDLSPLSKFPNPDASRLSEVEADTGSATLSLLPFHNAIIDPHLESVHVKVDKAGDYEILDGAMTFKGKASLFQDRYHWHNSKSILPVHLGGDKPKPTTPWEMRKKLRSDQKFMANLQRQAATLTGAKGQRLEPQVIAPVKAESAKAIKEKPALPVPKPSKKSKAAPPLKAADRIRKEIKEEKGKKSASEAEIWWNTQLESLDKMTIGSRIEHVEVLTRSKKADEGWLAIELALYRVHLECMQWIDDGTQELPATRDKYCVSLLRKIKDVLSLGPFSKSVGIVLTMLLDVLGFSHIAVTIDDKLTDRPLSFTFVKLYSKKQQKPVYPFFKITDHPLEFQLRVFGEFMDRSFDSQPDPRTSFQPDRWQREVLDKLDRQESVLVVAPTSAGKTFIAYYAMELVLRSGNDGVLVYVAPTKALVTQIAAEIHARFRKDLNGKSCWAVHTRDFRIHDPQNVQILVTVPEVLSIMLLSPPLAKTWTPRIKRIILDEIHTIGQEGGGAVWEQLLLLAPCPIIGLSATVGNPDQFNNWLATVQRAHGYQHSMVTHQHRYSHLRKFLYAKDSAVPRFEGLSQPVLGVNDRMVFVHPISTLGVGTASLPDDLALEARDCLTLFQAMRSIGDGSDELESLNPIRFFSDIEGRFLQQKDVISWETALKNILVKWMRDEDALDASSAFQEVVAKLQTQAIPSSPVGRDQSPARLIHLLRDLNQTGELPALLFNFDRNGCEDMAKELLAELVSSEKKWRATSQEWKAQVKEWENFNLKAELREKAASRTKKKRKDKEDDHADDSFIAPAFDLDDPSPEFSFASPKSSYSRAELLEDLHDLGRWGAVPDWALQCLRRGIAVHHAGMNKKYRSLVESLFRQGYLRVVIATGTLALGINMPCKTCIFVADSPFLTALMFRQCAGRAGRRGFDLLGNVIFYNLPVDRVHRLILSRIPPLTGQFPLTTTLCLRLFNLLCGSGDAPTAVAAIEGLLKLPSLSVTSDTNHEEILHHLRFSIDYLRRSRLLDADGRPLNLFGIAAHLHYSEPGNLALVALIRSGFLHDICKDFSSNRADAMNSLILILSHLFNRIYIPRMAIDGKPLQELIKASGYPSKVILPPLPAAASEALVKHNEEILNIYSGYAITFASQHNPRLGPDTTLPLTPGDLSPRVLLRSPPPFIRQLRASSVKVVARSLFVANSGHGDATFRSTDELADTVRRGIHLNKHAIPSLDLLTEGKSLNAVFLDFFNHGQVKALVEGNRIRRGDVWYLLQDFFLVLMIIQQSIEQLLLQASKEPDASTPPSNDNEDVEEEVEVDEEEAAETGLVDGTEAFKQKPAGVTQADWLVYRCVVATREEFEVKYKAMWA